MWPNSPFATPVSSFNHPVALIAPLPDDPPLVQVSVNAQYIPYILGCLQQLLLQSTWNTTDLSQVDIMQQKIWTLIGIVGNAATPYPPALGSAGAEEENLLRQNPANPCELQTSVDGVNWCTWADFSKCANFGTQPGAGTPNPQPGGGTSQQCVSLQANNQYILPSPVNAGDVITIVSATGVANDGTAQVGYCPDGSGFYAGECGNPPVTMSGDPVPTAPHMSLVINVGGTFYALYPGATFTVPGGVVNATAKMQANTASLASVIGSYSLCINHQNNQPATFTHFFDFTLSSGGFLPGGSIGGVWLPGVGWTQGAIQPPGDWWGIRAVLSFASRQLTYAKLDYQINGTRYATENVLQVLAGVTPAFNLTATPGVCATVSGYTERTVSPTSGDNFIMGMDSGLSGSCSPGNIVIPGLTVSGLGSDPF